MKTDLTKQRDSLVRIWYEICSKLTLQEQQRHTDTQEMIFLYRATKCLTEAEKNQYAIMN